MEHLSNIVNSITREIHKGSVIENDDLNETLNEFGFWVTTNENIFDHDIKDSSFVAFTDLCKNKYYNESTTEKTKFLISFLFIGVHHRMKRSWGIHKIQNEKIDLTIYHNMINKYIDDYESNKVI